MTKRVKQTSPLAQNVVKKLNEDLIHLGGLNDQHIKFITFFITDRLKINNFRFELRYLEAPKRFIIHVYTNENQEVWFSPKPANIIDKITEYLGINKDWRIEFAKRL